ncbi:MAG: DUF2812 domain-containing protein [Ruminococcaceae bacterium]|nr:DUF2812 domain-containing protein [Oscillospiraceae bacterium]
MAEEKYIYRLPPCPARDIDAMEAWLTDMAADGLLLTKDGFFGGFGIFRKDTPRRVRYRLTPTAKRPTIWSDFNDSLPQETLALWNRYGWEYITYRDDFHIFCTEDSLASDPPYDRETREQALAALSKRYRGSILSGVSVGLLSSMALDGDLVRATLYLGLWRSLFILAVLASFVMSSVFKAVHYRRLRRRLLDADSLHRESVDWRTRSWRHHILGGTQAAACIAMLAMLLTLWAAEVEDDGRLPLSDYPGTPPFAALEAFAPEGTRFVRDDSKFLTTNTYRAWSDPLAPVIIDWYETGDLQNNAGAEPNYISMDVTYYETVSPLLAKALAWECWWEHWLLNRRYQEYDLPSPEELGVDEARAFMGKHRLIQYVFRKGNIVCHITHFANYSPAPAVSRQEIAAIMAASLP